jgi:hypothetical protein
MRSLRVVSIAFMVVVLLTASLAVASGTTDIPGPMREACPNSTEGNVLIPYYCQIVDEIDPIPSSEQEHPSPSNVIQGTILRIALWSSWLIPIGGVI